MELISLADAKSQGLKKYFTGQPCMRGHLTFRRTDTRACWECFKIALHAWRSRNQETKKAIDQKSRANCADTRLPKKRSASKADYRRCPELYTEKSKARRAGVRRNTPTWADREQMRAIYKLATFLSRSTGIPHEVDHIVPLQGETVSGLHVHNNLQILTKLENRKKWNKLLEQT